MRHRVLVLGAGYAGIVAAKRLARRVRADDVEISLISATSSFIERPRLHQLAAGQVLKERSLARLLEGTGVQLVLAHVLGIDLQGKRVTLATGTDGSKHAVQAYDTLVYALGSNINVDGVPGVREHTTSLTGVQAAAEINARLTEVAHQSGSLAVCGAGLTGIETATEFAESFPRLRVKLVGSTDPGHHLSVRAQAYIRDAFDTLGVEIVSGVRIAEVQAGLLRFDDGSGLPFDICVWSGGFSVPRLAASGGLEVDERGRALVDTTLRSVSHPDVYVIGDAAAVPGPWGCELAMGCRSGGFTGPQVADVIAARLTGREPKSFRFRYFHECISLGRRRGLVQFLNADESPKTRILTGRPAIVYKNMTLNGAQLLFRFPGPFIARHRHLTPVPDSALSAA